MKEGSFKTSRIDFRLSTIHARDEYIHSPTAFACLVALPKWRPDRGIVLRCSAKLSLGAGGYGMKLVGIVTSGGKRIRLTPLRALSFSLLRDASFSASACMCDAFCAYYVCVCACVCTQAALSFSLLRVAFRSASGVHVYCDWYMLHIYIYILHIYKHLQ